jgi:hypothetical protein
VPVAQYCKARIEKHRILLGYGLRHEQPGRKIRPTVLEPFLFVLNGMRGRQLESNVSILVAIFP